MKFAEKACVNGAPHAKDAKTLPSCGALACSPSQVYLSQELARQKAKQYSKESTAKDWGGLGERRRGVRAGLGWELAALEAEADEVLLCVAAHGALVPSAHVRGHLGESASARAERCPSSTRLHLLTQSINQQLTH